MAREQPATTDLSHFCHYFENYMNRSLTEGLHLQAVVRELLETTDLFHFSHYFENYMKLVSRRRGSTTECGKEPPSTIKRPSAFSHHFENYL